MDERILDLNGVTRELSPSEHYGPCPRPRWRRRGEGVDAKREPAPCDDHACASCGPRLHGSHTGHFTERFAEAQAECGDGFDLFAVTFTLDTAEPSVMGQVAELNAITAAALDRLRDLSNAGGHSLLYLLVVEVGEKGGVHLHGIVGGALTAETITSVWVQKGGGVSSETNPIESRRHLGGCIKYALEDQFGPGRLRLPGVRQIRCSQGIGYEAETSKARRKAHQQRRYGDERVYWADDERARQAQRHAEINADREVRKTRKLLLSGQPASQATPSDPVRPKARRPSFIEWVTPTHGIRTERDLMTGKLVSIKVMAKTGGRPHFECDCGTHKEAVTVCEAMHAVTTKLIQVTGDTSAEVHPAPIQVRQYTPAPARRPAQRTPLSDSVTGTVTHPGITASAAPGVTYLPRVNAALRSRAPGRRGGTSLVPRASSTWGAGRGRAPPDAQASASI